MCRDVLIGQNLQAAATKSTIMLEELPNDLARVDMLFQDACRSISEEEISFLILSGKYIAIALVDHNKLSHAWQDFHVPGVLSSNSDYTGDIFALTYLHMLHMHSYVAIMLYKYQAFF
ncbi:unnamed protein product [Trifolium pratense]|uniref:Uncharacterized protein n=1 Tax=Trifolium pratense TaxID=57577 RepID=A0ACB0JJY3_TRIPR|nr:unnamed protein product [Trifolium pratense]